MSSFTYTVRTTTGDRVEGEISADTVESAREMLVLRGLTVERISVLETTRPGSPGELSSEEATQLAYHLADLASSGLPLTTGLRALAEEAPSRNLATLLRDLADQTEAGRPLPQAFELASVRAPSYLRSLVGSGLQSGRLPETLERLVQQQGRIDSLRRRARGALVYPAILVLVYVAIFSIATTKLLPDFKDILDSFGIAELPWPSEIMQWLAAQGIGFLASIWGGVLAIAVLLWLFRRSAAVDHLLSTVPVIGRLRSYLELTEFSYLLGMLLEQSMPLTTALETTATGLNHTPMATACRDIAANVGQGKSLAKSLALLKFPPALQAMVGWGEQQGTLPYALEAAGDFYAARAELEEGLLRHAITPLTLLLLLAGVLFLVRGLLGPMVKLITTLTG